MKYYFEVTYACGDVGFVAVTAASAKKAQHKAKEFVGFDTKMKDITEKFADFTQ